MAKRKSKKKHEEEEAYGLNFQYEDQSTEVVGLNTSLDEEGEDAYTALNNLDEQDETPIFNEDELDVRVPLQEDDQEDLDTSEQLGLVQEIDESNNEGVNIPPARAVRDPRKSKDPLEGEDLGLREGDFLLSRKITSEDLEAHNDIHQDGLLGSNMRHHKDFAEIFSRGVSTDENPKVDTVYGIENNKVDQGEMAAKQLLRNCHSRDNKEKNNAIQVLRTMGLDDDLIQEIKSTSDAHDESKLVAIVSAYF